MIFDRGRAFEMTAEGVPVSKELVSGLRPHMCDHIRRFGPLRPDRFPRLIKWHQSSDTTPGTVEFPLLSFSVFYQAPLQYLREVFYGK